MKEIILFDSVEIPTAMGKPFVVDSCYNCSQLILIHPDRYRPDLGELCEACNDKTANKYMRFLKLKL